MPPKSATSDAGLPIRESVSRTRFAIAVRSAIFNILFYINILILMIGGLPSVLMGRRAAMFMARTWARTSLWLLRMICGTRMEFRGLDLIPQDGVVIAAKHQSILETFALVVHVPDFAYVFKRELNWIPLFGWYLMAVEQIAINRSAGSTALTQVTNGIESFLKDKRAIFIFPEGTRRAVGAPPSYKHGVTHVYTTLGARVMPVALNTGVFWPRRSFLRKPGTAIIEFLPVIEPGLPADEFARRLEETIETRTNAHVGEALRRDPSLAAPPTKND
jgi:1-acyl-sn-glycerol-3-phosphate acyltransferase